jgi:lipopolysaccharide export system permease protein
MSNDAEILALKACGVSLYQILPPVIMVALSISLVSSYFSVNLVPAGDTAMKQLMFQLAKEKIDKGIREHEFTEALGDLVVYVGKIDRDTGNWQNVWVSDMRGQTVPTITMAKSGQMYTELNKMQVTIVLENGSLHRSVNNQSQTVSFDKYRLNIPIQLPNQDPDNISRGGMSMAQLKKMAQEAGPDTPSGRESLVHYHKRLVLPAGCFLLTLIGFSLGLQSGPGKPAVGVPLGLAFFIAYYVCFTIGKRLAELSSLPVSVAMWAPNVVFALIMAYMIHKTSKERSFLPDMVHEKYLSLLGWLSAKDILSQKRH